MWEESQKMTRREQAVLQALGRAIFNARKNKYSRKGFADRVGVSAGTIKRIEAGAGFCRPDIIVRILLALGLDQEQLARQMGESVVDKYQIEVSTDLVLAKRLPNGYPQPVATAVTIRLFVIPELWES
jgi:DNA-binding XRE family transcriptional regulator